MHSAGREWFNDLCVKNGLNPTTGQLEQLDNYAKLLLEWNKKINLISRKDEENIWTYHILHSISPLFKIALLKDCSIVDIGTGGGLPGIPIKIMRPDISFLFIDSIGKKIKALSQIANDLSLSGIKIVWGRAEETGIKPEFKGKFDYALARSVAPLIDLITWSRGFLKSKLFVNQNIERDSNRNIKVDPPALLTFKGGDVSKEIEVAKKKHSQLDIESINLLFPGGDEFISLDKKILVVHF